MPSVDYATFCHKGDGWRLHSPGHLKRQVLSNGYDFNRVIVIHQLCHPYGFDNPVFSDCDFLLNSYTISNLDEVLRKYNIDPDKPQYVSDVDRAHTWKNHVVNHLAAAAYSNADYIVFADSDCWIVSQPDSWVIQAINILSAHPDIFIVSPNDGEPERRTQVMSQQMFMARTVDFRQADFNQPGWDGNPHVEGGPFPEYWALLEGRIGLYCIATNRYRYVLPSAYRYWHHNRTDPATNYFETDLSKY